MFTVCLSPLPCYSFSCRQMPCHLSSSFTPLTQSFNLLLPLCLSFTLLPAYISPALPCLSLLFLVLWVTQLSSPCSQLLVFHHCSLHRHQDLIQRCPCDWYALTIITVYCVIHYLFLLSLTSLDLMCTMSSFISAKTVFKSNKLIHSFTIIRRKQQHIYITCTHTVDTHLYLLLLLITTYFYTCLQRYCVYLYIGKHVRIWSCTFVVLQQHSLICISYSICIVSFAGIINSLLQMVPVLDFTLSFRYCLRKQKGEDSRC